MYQKKTKYLIFEEIPPTKTRKTKIILIYNKSGEDLGEIKWYSSWRQYCYFNDENNVCLAKSCLDDISAVIEELLEMRKNV